MVEKYLSETEIRKLLQCSRCRRSPTSPPVYICRTGHLECCACYVKFSEVPRVDERDASTDSESDSHNTHHSCPICKEEVLNTRNILAENLLLHLEYVKNGQKQGLTDSNCVECCYNIYPCPRFEAPSMTMAPYESQPYGRYQVSSGMEHCSYQMDPYLANDPAAEYNDPNIFYGDYDNVSYYNGCTNRREVLDKRNSRCNFGLKPSVTSLAGEPSKRPIRCPTHLCGRNIAVTALTSHFCFDHPDVPPVSVDFDVSSHLFVVPDAIPFNYGRCVAMLLIPNRLEPVSSVSHSELISSPKGKNSLPLVVMASRLDCITSPQSSTGNEENTRTETLNQGDFRTRERCRPDSSSKTATPATLGNVKTPLLVIWLAGLETNSSLFTTLQVTEKQTNVRSVVYTGPVTSLRSNQNTTNVLEQGDCLVIHSGILENIIGDRGGFDLHVVVH